MAVLAYLPLLLTAPGKVAADTKVYLYTDPGRLLSRAAWMWDPDVAAGTVPHQNIGYLFPMGPYYWLCEAIGLPDWVAQRLWLGSVLLAAGAGTWWLLCRLGVRSWPALAGALVYLASPYVLPYLGRTSVLLLPWAALPWLLGLIDESLRTRGWRAPALFALVLTVVAGTNASSVVFTAIGPALWVPYVVFLRREVDLRRAVRALATLAAVCIPAQLWWIAGLRIQGRYGLPILQLTETVETVAETSTAAEVARGMGYWYAYGRDGLSAWTPDAVPHTQRLLLIAASFAVPAACLAGAAITRWRHRSFFVVLVVTGLVLGVGTHPHDDPAPFGALVKAATDASSVAMALRNSPRAVPLLVLGLAALGAAGVDAAATWFATRARPRVARGLVAGLAVLAVVNLTPVWAGGAVSADLRFPETLPAYWRDAAAALDASEQAGSTRVLELPGSDFAVYRWGQTQDPITPGLMDRAWLGRELTAFGTEGTADLVRALDRRLQEGVFDPRAVAPIARLFGVGDVLVRADTQYERYRGPRPRVVADQLARAPGLGAPTTFGEPTPNIADARRPMRDEAELATPPTLPDPAPLTVYPVSDPRPIVSTRTAASPLVVAGDGESLVDAAEAGLLSTDQLILYAATLAADPDRLDDALERGADLLVADGNRRRGERWGTVRDNTGYTEPAGSEPLVADTKDFRLGLFPDATDDARTVAVPRGVESVSATAYGNIVAFAPDQRPFNALDGDLRTAWQLGGFSDVVGERLRVELTEPVEADHVVLAQTSGNRWITRVGIWLDGRRVATADLVDPSFLDVGQRIDFPAQRFERLEISLDEANVSGLQNYLGWSSVGIRELRIPGVTAEELIRVPVELLRAIGDRAVDHDLTVLLTRLRADPAEPWRSDPEQMLRRLVELPAARAFGLTGEARLEGRADGALVDQIIGRPGLSAGFAVASGGDYLAGSLATRPSAAIDGDAATAWTPGFGPQGGRGFTLTVPRPVTVSHLDLQVLADGWHSVPTRLAFELAEGTTVTVDVPAVEDRRTRGEVVALRVPIEGGLTITTSAVVRVVEAREVTSIEYFSGEPAALPVGITELGIAGVAAGPVPDRLPSSCRSDLLSIDGRPVGVRVEGTAADALARRPLAVSACAAGPITLAAGPTTLRSANGIDVGVALDRLVLVSPAPAGELAGGSDATAAPVIEVDETSRLGYRVVVSDADAPFWLVLGQSRSDGWRLTVDGNDLGPSTLVDGYANGWLLDPAVLGTGFTATIAWAPQRLVWGALAVSGLTIAALVAIVVATSRRPRALAPGATTLATGATPVLLGRPHDRDALPARSALAAAVALALAAGFAGGLVPAVVVGAAVAAGLWRPRLGVVLTALPAATVAATGAWYVLKQYRNAFPPGVEWPTAFGAAHTMVLVGVLALGADTVVRHLVGRRRGGNLGP